MIDRSFGDYGRMLRAPDLRLEDVQTVFLCGLPPFDHRVNDPKRGIFIYARRGNFTLQIEGTSQPPIAVKQGSAIGFENGRAHRWQATAETSGLGPGETVELFVSTIPRRMGVLQQLENGMILIPPDIEPFASIVLHSVEIHLSEFLNPHPSNDDAVIRRCAEIVLMQFVRYARLKVAEQPDAPAGLVHDEYLLRAWSAYFADPNRRWTVKALADAAGLGRTTFAERFRKIFGAPPLQTMTELRLEQASTMLRCSKAPLIEIAFTVGYNSEAAFVRAFHRKYGKPPGKFRAEQSQ